MASPNLRFARAIDRIQNGPFSSSLTTRATKSVEDILSQLETGGRRAARARSIIAEALEVGYSDVAAIHIAIIAAAESAFDPNAKHKDTKTAGYFQLHPKYWSESAVTTSPNILRRQLKQIRSRYGDDVLEDLSVFYGTHFYPGLGAAFSGSRVLGLQPGSRTYGQYAFVDAAGTVFHSPAIMALYAAEKFESLTNVDPEVEVPKLPVVVTKTGTSGRAVISSVELVFPIVPTTAKRFTTSNLSARTTVSFLDPANLINFEGVSPSFENMDWPLSKDLVTVEISEIDASISSDRVNPLLAATIERYGITSAPATILLPAFDTLIHRIKKGGIDFEIMKAILLDIAFSDEQIGPALVRTNEQSTRRVEESDASKILRAKFTSDEDFKDMLLNLSDKELGAVLQTMLDWQLSVSSLTGLSTQLANHRTVLLSLDLSGEEDENFNDQWDIPWFTYVGVLYPASLLVTPSFGAAASTLRLAVGNRYANSLFRWTRETSTDVGMATILVMLRGLVPRSKKAEPKRKRTQ